MRLWPLFLRIILMEDYRPDNQRPHRSEEPEAPQGHPYLTSQPPASTAKKRSYTFGKALRDIVIPLIIAFAVAMFVQATVAKPYKIPSGSMLPTIKLGDRVIANRLVYHYKDIERGDVVVFEPPNQDMTEANVPFIKRVIGLPGDTVEVIHGQTLVNGVEYDVPDADAPSYTRPAEVVPEGQLFVLGDNRDQSSDSHIWGYVPIENVIGRVEFIYWPPEHMSFV